MADVYAPKRARVAALIKRWSTGTITLTRTSPGMPDPDKPWLRDPPSTDVYTLYARADGVADQYVDDETIVASDLMVIVSPKALDADGAIVDIEPRMSDVLTIDGAQKAIKKIEAVPAAGAPARFHVFVAS